VIVPTTRLLALALIGIFPVALHNSQDLAICIDDHRPPQLRAPAAVIVPTTRLLALALVGILPVALGGSQDLTIHIDDHSPLNIGYPHP
jgi:hypothetical protein